VKTSLIKMGFIGSYKIDLLIYMGMIFNHMDLKVLIMDISPERYLKYYISGVAIEGVTHLQGIDYCLADIPESQMEGYDIMLCDYGLSLKDLDGYINCQWHFLITDAKKHHIEPLRYQCKLIGEQSAHKVELVKLYRDMVGSKIDESYLDYILEISTYFEVIGSYILTCCVEDYKVNLLNSYNEQIRFSGLSKQYLDFFRDVVEEVLEEESGNLHKAITSAISKAKKGVSVI